MLYKKADGTVDEEVWEKEEEDDEEVFKTQSFLLEKFICHFCEIQSRNKTSSLEVVKMGNMKNFHSLLDTLPLLSSPKEEGLPGASDFQNRFLT